MATQAAAHEAEIAEERRLRKEEARRAQAEVQQQMAQMYSFIQGLRFRWVNNYLRWHSADSGSGSGNSSCEQLDNLGSFISNIRDLEIVQT